MKWLVWILQGVIILSLLPAGLQKLSGNQELMDMFTSFYGYGTGVVYLAGAMEVAAAVLLSIGFWKKPIGLVGSVIAAVVMFGGVLSQMKADASIFAPLLFVIFSLIVFIGTLNQINKEG